jgi:protein-tyrosine kinase
MLKNLIVETDPNSPTAETIRCLRTNILFLNMGRASKVISLTSPAPQEGKSFLTANLAAATAQSNKKTLVIDCDMRRMGLSRMLGLGGKKGLSNILAKKEVSLKGLYLYDIGIENLKVLPSGPTPPNPAEILGQEGVDSLLAIARNEFDIVYIDVPPVLSVADPIIICKKTDTTILIVMADTTPQKAAIRTYSLLKEAGINMMGIVLNKVDAGLSGLYRYRYRYRYYYSKK